MTVRRVGGPAYPHSPERRGANRPRALSRRLVFPVTLLVCGLAIGMLWPAEGQNVTTPGAATPLLFGVIYGERGWIAYIQDPTTKSVAAYRVGDAVAGRTIVTIEDERVVLAGPDGTVEIRLSDEKPGAPRPPSRR